MSENTVTHPAIAALTALLNGAIIREPSGRRVCLGYDQKQNDRRALAVIADRECPGQPPDTVLLPLDVTVTDFIAWATELPAAAVLPSNAPVENDYIGAFLLGDVHAAVPELTAGQCYELLNDHRNSLESQLKAALRQSMLRFAQEDELLPPPADADPLHLGDFGLADIQDELSDLTLPQIEALLAEYREDLEEQIGAAGRRLFREFAAKMDWSAVDACAAEEPAPF
ncbi:MAG TPA: hypothetical protein PKH77_19840 [Anaerolineae bacterium]|nr:hypothetical protein [Anaerolineae bacterium]